MKKGFYLLLPLLMCLFASCQKEDDVEPEPQPEPQPLVVRYAEYETTDDYVDMGFANVMFATRNLGAKRPEDVGFFFAWGETEPKDVYSWDTYKLQGSKFYYKDNGQLQPQDDAATVMLGKGWRLLTGDEVKLLYDSYTTDDNCTKMRPTVSNGIFGYELTGPNGNSIFIPSNGIMRDNELTFWSVGAQLWTATCGKGRAFPIFTIDFTGVSYFETLDRNYGLPIRPVKEKKAEPDTVYLKLNVLDRNIAEAQRLQSTLNPAEYSTASYQELLTRCQRAIDMRAYVIENDGQKKHAYLGNINKVNKALQDSIDYASHWLRMAIVGLDRLPAPSDIEAVDLGLSVRWASCNIGARSATEYGYFFAWGETSPKQGNYDWSNYTFCKDADEGHFTKYVTDSRWGNVDGKTRLEPGDDAAHAFLGGNWRMPTSDEFQELADRCTLEVVTLLGYSVIRATGPNGNCIYFPKTGSTSIIDQICCWTADLQTAANNHGVSYQIDSFWAEAFKTWEDRCVGQTVRAVCP